METRPFDRNAQAGVNIPGPTPKQVSPLRFPTDDEWRSHLHRLQLRRGDVEAKNNRSLTDLVESLSDKPLLLDLPERRHVIGRLTSFESNAWIENGEVRVEAKVFGGSTVDFTFRMPTVATLRDEKGRVWDEQTVVIRRIGGTAIGAINVKKQEDAYKEHLLAVEGYEGDVPLFHKLSAVAALMEAAAEGLTSEDNDFFMDGRQSPDSTTSAATSSEAAKPADSDARPQGGSDARV